MKFISIANPAPSEGVGFDPKKDLVVPDQSLSLEEILYRFTRGEQMAVGKPTYYDSLDDDDEEGYDYEKISKMDITDKMQFQELLKERINSMRQSQTIDSLDNNSLTDTTENEK